MNLHVVSEVLGLKPWKQINASVGWVQNDDLLACKGTDVKLCLHLRWSFHFNRESLKY